MNTSSNLNEINTMDIAVYTNLFLRRASIELSNFVRTFSGIVTGKLPLHATKYLGDVNHAADGGWTPVHIASKEEHLELVRFLVEQGGGVNHTANYGWTSVHIACHYGHLELVR